MNQQQQKIRTVLAVEFRGCGAETHPAFGSATLIGNNVYRIAYPIHIRGYMKSYEAQMAWASDKIAHLKSWGAQGKIVQ
jgi:hypothetical protein